MQVYDRGLRRRLAAMFDGDQTRLKMAFWLLLALPGTPVIWYGDEIGMGDDLSLKEREAVRTPMQWSPHTNGGFSIAPRSKLVRPVIDKGMFGYRKVNAAMETQHRDSFFHAIADMVSARRSAPEIGWGGVDIVDIGDDDVLVLSSAWRGNRVITAHNFSDRPKTFHLVEEGIEKLMPMLSDSPTGPIEGDAEISLEAFGYCWL